MRNSILLALIIFILSSCKKDDNNGSINNNPNNSNGSCSTPPYRVGSIFEGESSNGERQKNIFEKDTIIGSRKYIRYKNSSSSLYQYVSFDPNGDVIVSYLRGLNDLNETDILFIRVDAPVGTKWNYNFNSYTNVNIKHKYSFEVISRNETLIFNSKKYLDGIKTRLIIESFNNGTLQNKIEGETTYFCGLGVAEEKINQNIYKLIYYKF